MKVIFMRKGKMRRAVAAATAVALLGNLLAACSTVQTQVAELETNATRQIAAAQEKADLPVPIITSTSAAWLMGEAVEVAAPQSPLLARPATYHPAQRVSLIDVATYVSGLTGIKVDTVEVQGRAASAQATATAPAALAVPFPTFATQQQGAGADAGPTLQPFAISYEGTVAGLLDVAANKSGVSWKFDQGRLSFYRTETRTFYIPAVKLTSSGDSIISATAASSGSGQGGTGGSAPSGGQSSGSTGGTNSKSTYEVDLWGDLEKNAKTVAGGAQIVVNRSMSSITVNGTPGQIRNVEEWVRSLGGEMSQQVEVTVQVYQVRTTAEDTYNWTPNVIFKSLKNKYGFNLTGLEAPPVLSGSDPMSFSAAILEGATGRKGELTGSQLAFQALSKLGTTTETLRKSVVSLNGQPAPMQVARQISYIASATAPTAVPTGTIPPSPTLTPGTVTVGLTAMFLPQIANGKIVLSMNMTNSSLVSLGTVPGSQVQSPNIDVSTFQQSVSLTPGSSLLMTAMQQDIGKSDQRGVGAANNYALGGGSGRNTDKQLIAIVITAKVL
jgi:type IVB pilus formation R64 PilN family outer membrane protein